MEQVEGIGGRTARVRIGMPTGARAGDQRAFGVPLGLLDGSSPHDKAGLPSEARQAQSLFCVSFCAPRTLNTIALSRVTLSLQ